MTIRRAYPSVPLLGVSVLCHHQDKVLMIKRGKPPYEGHWSLPGGLVDLGEPLKTAAERELLEETGITASLGAPVDTFDSIQTDPNGDVVSHFVLVVFSGPYLAGRLEAGDDAADASWMQRDKLDSLMTTPGTPDRIRKILLGGGSSY
jgi:8-oxo-dGTP diphosphatase